MRPRVYGSEAFTRSPGVRLALTVIILIPRAAAYERGYTPAISAHWVENVQYYLMPRLPSGRLPRGDVVLARLAYAEDSELNPLDISEEL
jgi:hypothetical protein